MLPKWLNFIACNTATALTKDRELNRWGGTHSQITIQMEWTENQIYCVGYFSFVVFISKKYFRLLLFIYLKKVRKENSIITLLLISIETGKQKTSTYVEWMIGSYQHRHGQFRVYDWVLSTNDGWGNIYDEDGVEPITTWEKFKSESRKAFYHLYVVEQTWSKLWHLME